MLHLKKKYHMCWCVCYYKATLKQFNDTFHTHAKNKFNTLNISQPQIPSKGNTRLLLSFLNSTHNKEAQHTMEEALIPVSHNVHTETKFEGIRPDNSNQKGSSLTFFLPLFSLTTSLSFLSQRVHGERKAFLAVTKASWQRQPSHQASRIFLAQHVQGHVTA